MWVVLIDAAVLIAAIGCRSAFAERGYDIPFFISVAVLCLVMPIFVKPHILWLKPTKHGKIIDIKYDTYTKVDNLAVRSGSFKAGGQFKKTTDALFLADGENCEAFEFALPKRYDSVYKVGDEIILFGGFVYPLVLSEPHTKQVCIACGNIVPNGETKCVGCDEDIVVLRNVK